MVKTKIWRYLKIQRGRGIFLLLMADFEMKVEVKTQKSASHHGKARISEAPYSAKYALQRMGPDLI